MSQHFVPPYRTLATLPEFLELNAARTPEKPFLWAKKDGIYSSINWKETADQVKACAAGLAALGISPGDRVVLVSENRPEWLIADFGIMTAGAITVPTYTTNTVADHQHILSDSSPKAVIVSTPALATRLAEAITRENLPIPLITMLPFESNQHSVAEVRSWASLLASGTEPPQIPGRRDDVACMIYTSGTGGSPKGVMLTHDNLITNCEGCWDHWNNLLPADGSARFLSFLPLSHSYEHTVGQSFPVTVGAHIYYAEGVDKLTQNMVSARPMLMTAVPRLYDLMRAKILAANAKHPAWRRAQFDLALKLGGKSMDDPNSLTPQETRRNRLLDSQVRTGVRARFGGTLKGMISGGAPLNPEIGRFFTALGVQILQGYGQTESAPVIAANRLPGAKMETVGPMFSCVTVRLAEDGEILVKGRSVMKGYWNRPEETAAAIDAEGWLHTGDVGLIDSDRHLVITDRKKDIIVNSGGDNVSPQRVEGLLTLAPEIGQTMVYGDQRPHLVALIVPSAAFASDFTAKAGKTDDLTQLITDPDFIKAMRGAIKRVNVTLSAIEQIRKFTLTAESFTVENDMMTPTMKIRRHVIRERYGDALEALYR
ncbi:MAG: long-chain fatty acid--CoA ligase [Rhodospirillaceae bacterium]|nr:long-chain fatty acid--CoA ligase [Rhodospirillaceae bacterium]